MPVIEAKGLKEKLTAMHTEETMKVELELLYWRENGEVKKSSWEALLVKELLEEKGYNPVASFLVRESDTGKERAEIFAIPGGLAIRTVWSPSPGYSWDEEKIYVLRFDAPLEISQ